MNVLVLGGAPSMLVDVATSEVVLGPRWWDAVVAVNEAVSRWIRPIQAWATLHPWKLREWMPDGRYRFGRTYAPQRADLVDRVVMHWGGGAAGLYGVRIAHWIGGTRTVTAGCPMTDDFAEDAEMFREHWRRHHKRDGQAGRYLRGSVRSVSGFTRDLLGFPDRDWLAGGRTEPVVRRFEEPTGTEAPWQA